MPSQGAACPALLEDMQLMKPGRMEETLQHTVQVARITEIFQAANSNTVRDAQAATQ